MSFCVDVAVVVDWSAHSAPKLGKDSIWIAVAHADGAAPPVAVNLPTRAAARHWLSGLLCAQADRRVLVGWDFPLGYPAGTAQRFGVATAGRPCWRALWDLLVTVINDDDRNRNDRFAAAASLNARASARAGASAGVGPGPFWGCPASAAGALLTPTKPPFPCLGLAEFRAAEQRLRAGGRWVSSTWQLLGIGSVGSQSLLGIPVVASLLEHPELAPRSEVWPFTTGLTSCPAAGRPDAVVHAEVWPSQIPADPHLGAGDRLLVRDEAQVLTLATRLAAASGAGTLGACFDPPMETAQRDAVLAEEGWVLVMDEQP